MAFSIVARQVNAATFDFGADANAFWFANTNSDRYEGTFDQVYGISNLARDSTASDAGTLGGNMMDGITVTATASKAGLELAHPFMDSRGPYAGLGVCSSGFQTSGISECSSNGGSNTGDDNLLFTELLEPYFDGKNVAIDGLQIRDANHDLISNEDDANTINCEVFGTGSNGQVNLAGLLVADTYTFTSAGSSEEILGSRSFSDTAACSEIPAAGWSGCDGTPPQSLTQNDIL